MSIALNVQYILKKSNSTQRWTICIVDNVLVKFATG